LQKEAQAPGFDLRISDTFQSISAIAYPLFSCYHCLRSNDAYSHFHPALWQLDDNYHRAAIFCFVQALGLEQLRLQEYRKHFM
jgi:hypothetical protein